MLKNLKLKLKIALGYPLDAKDFPNFHGVGSKQELNYYLKVVRKEKEKYPLCYNNMGARWYWAQVELDIKHRIMSINMFGNYEGVRIINK